MSHSSSPFAPTFPASPRNLCLAGVFFVAPGVCSKNKEQSKGLRAGLHTRRQQVSQGKKPRYAIFKRLWEDFNISTSHHTKYITNARLSRTLIKANGFYWHPQNWGMGTMARRAFNVCNKNNSSSSSSSTHKPIHIRRQNVRPKVKR